MISDNEKYAVERAKVQAELDRLPRVNISGETFRKTKEEHNELDIARGQYKSNMYGLFGQHWRKLSRMLGVLNVPSDSGRRRSVQSEAEARSKNVR